MTEEPSEKLLKDVAERIERQYSEAIAGLEAIRRFLAPVCTVVDIPSKSTANIARNGSKRSKVFSVMGSEMQTVAEIAAKASLPEQDVRAVLYARGDRGIGLWSKKLGGRVKFGLRPRKEGDG